MRENEAMPRRKGRRTPSFILVITVTGLLLQVRGLGKEGTVSPATAQDKAWRAASGKTQLRRRHRRLQPGAPVEIRLCRGIQRPRPRLLLERGIPQGNCSLQPGDRIAARLPKRF